ncbi:ABC transporter ATP-binding protein, partial [Nocardioides guangzhouensis]
MTTATTGLAHTVAASDLTKTYGALRAVDGLDLAVGGGVVGLLGPNGAGKT